MSSPQSIPLIRVDLLDGSPHNLTPSSTLDIRDILNRGKLWPDLLAEDFVFNDAGVASCLEVGRLENVPPFPMGRKPPLFILQSHRVRLPFPIRQDAFEMGDFCGDGEDIRPLLTAPTMPRMKLMIREQVYVQKWVDTLTSDNPPKHIPWSCEKPAVERKWVAEGSIFPSLTVQSEHRPTAQKHSFGMDTNGFSVHADHVPHSSELSAFSEASGIIHASTESHASTLRVSVKPADVEPGILRGELKISPTPESVVRSSQAASSQTILSPGLSMGATLTTPDARLVTRRGKSLDGLRLKGSVIEQLEYPDIPTAFRGSSSVWSPQFDAFSIPSFTDHRSMLLELKLKCAALENGVSTYVPESLRPQPEIPRTSLNVDEWMFTRGLTALGDDLESVDGDVPKEVVADMSIFVPEHSSTPMKGPRLTAHFGFVSRPHSTPASHSPVKRSSDPPEVPLPPRPALVNPSTPPHVRGILKKVKSVRFEDAVTNELKETSLLISSPRHSVECPYLAVPSGRPCTPMPNTTKSSSGPVPAIGLVKSAGENKPAPKTRLPPKRSKANGKLEPIRPKVGDAPETSKPSMAASVERPCRIAQIKKNTNPATVPLARTKQGRVSITETDIRRGIEGASKSRLSTPLRNIFRFR